MDDKNQDYKREQDRKKNDRRWVLSTPQGRRFYWELMSECKPFSDAFIQDPMLSSYMKGRRSVGLDMFNDLLETDSPAYMQMMQENKSQETRKEIKQERNMKEKISKPYKFDSPRLPNTGREMSKKGE